jgi:hypothetical protein
MPSASQSARLAIVAYSLGITGTLMVFLLLAQPLHMRFNYANEENLRLIDIVLPTFLGYLGAASHFLFNSNRGREVEKENAGFRRQERLLRTHPTCNELGELGLRGRCIAMENDQCRVR